MLQTLINNLYRIPKSRWKEIIRFGGFFSYKKILKQKKKMIIASQKIPAIFSHEDGLNVYFLTGKKYLYQTLFCAHSLVKFATKEKFKFTLIDDGSFDTEFISQIHLQMPGVKIITQAEIEKNLSNKLPISEYPYLHHKRNVYPHIKKLTDIHTINDNSYKLVLDSDMLFWNEPTELINWLKQPDGCIYMLDCAEAYGFDRSLMKLLCGYEIPDLVNVGAFGLQSSDINWHDVEYWSKTLEEKQGPSYFLEQALSAMIIANHTKTILNKEQYIVNPTEQKGKNIKLHHYVDLSKKYYYENALRNLMEFTAKSE